MTLHKYRPIEIDGEIARVHLTMGMIAVIDASDVPLVEGRHWQARRTAWNFYAGTSVVLPNGKRGILEMHRVVMGCPRNMNVDHIDCDGLNNRRSNLRIATDSQNSRNSRLRSDNTSGFKGVRRKAGRWAAEIQVNLGRVHLGYFDTADEAFAAYRIAAEKLHGEFARPASARALYDLSEAA